MKTKFTKFKALSIVTACSLLAFGSVANAGSESFDDPADVADVVSPLDQYNEGQYKIGQYTKAATLAAKQNLRIVYLGSNQLTAQLHKGLRAAGVLDTKGSKQIVIVDSDYQDKELLVRLLAQGNFVVSVGQTKINTTKSASAMLEAIESNQKMKRDAEYDADQNQLVASNSTTSGVLEEMVYADYFSPNGWKTFKTTEQDVTLAIAESLMWASNIQEASGVSQAKSDDWGNPVRSVLQSVTCSHKPTGGQTRLAGKLNAIADYFKKPNDGSTTYDYWYVRFSPESLPGYLLKQQGANAHEQFRTNKVTNSANFDATKPFKLLSYSPKTAQNPSTFSVSMDSTGVGSIGWSYTVPDVSVAALGDTAANDVKWTHNVNTTTLSGRSQVTFEPGAMIRVPQNQGIYTHFAQSYEAEFYAYFRLPFSSIGVPTYVKCSASNPVAD